MRRFFIMISILVLVALISAGISQKIERSNIQEMKLQETSAFHRYNNV